MGRVLLVVMVFLSGCAGFPECQQYEGEEFKQCQKDVREYRNSMDNENWALCERIYKQMGKPTYHKDHSHDRGASTPHSRQANVKTDLMMNNCKRVIPKDYWARY